MASDYQGRLTGRQIDALPGLVSTAQTTADQAAAAAAEEETRAKAVEQNLQAAIIAGVGTTDAVVVPAITGEETSTVNPPSIKGVVDYVAQETNKISNELGPKIGKLQRIIKDDETGDFVFTDGDGHVAFKISSNGANARQYNICDASGNVLYTINDTFLATLQAIIPKVNEIDQIVNDDNSGNFVFVDSNGNVAFKISTNGASAKQFNICDSSGNVLYTIDKAFLASLSNIFYDDSDGSFKFVDTYGRVALQIDEDGKLDFAALTDHARDVIKGEAVKIVCWGDSLTQGQGAKNKTIDATVFAKLLEMGYDLSSVITGVNNKWVVDLQIMLGDGYELINQGVGGETMSEIAARQGATLAVINKDIVLPATAGTEVQISDSTDMLTAQWDSEQTIRWTNQVNDMSLYNPIYVQGIPCNLRIDKESGTHPTDMYITRIEDGERDVTLPSGTAFMCQGSKNCSNADIYIFWCYTNGGFDYDLHDGSDLVAKMKKMVEHTNGRYLIIGYHNLTEYMHKLYNEEALEAQFGDHFLNWRKYACTNALLDFGVTPTEADETYMAQGCLPPSFWRAINGENGATVDDPIHMNASGYAILAYKIKERLEQIGLI